MSHVGKTYLSIHKSNEVVRDVSLDVEENEFVVLFGPGQCGKTTMINLIAGLQLPTTGEIHVDGKKVEAPRIGSRRCISDDRTLSILHSDGKCRVRPEEPGRREKRAPGACSVLYRPGRAAGV